MADLRVVPAALAVCVALLITGASYAADKIVLVCSGTSSIAGTLVKNPMTDPMTLIIDLDRRIVTNSWVGFQESAITEVTESEINFQGAKPEFGTWKGAIDRYSGSAWLSLHSVLRDQNNFQLTQVYNLTCKPAQPLF